MMMFYFSWKQTRYFEGINIKHRIPTSSSALIQHLTWPQTLNTVKKFKYTLHTSASNQTCWEILLTSSLISILNIRSVAAGRVDDITHFSGYNHLLVDSEEVST